MAARFKFALDPLVVVELAVGNDADALVLARNRLVAGGEIDDAEPRVAESDATVLSIQCRCPSGPRRSSCAWRARGLRARLYLALRKARRFRTSRSSYTTRRVPSAAQHPAAQPGNVSPNRGRIDEMGSAAPAARGLDLAIGTLER